METKEITLIGAVNFRKAENFAKGDKPDFEILAYSGRAVERAFGSLAIDVAGIECKEKMPVFREHDRTLIIGYSTATRKAEGFHVTGRFSGTDAAQEVKALAADGFPWQASIGVSPLPGAVSTIPENKKALINGHQVIGPCEIWHRTRVFETSFVTLRADDNTHVSTFGGHYQGLCFDRSGEMRRFYQSQSLQREFDGDVEVYLAYRMARENGLVQI